MRLFLFSASVFYLLGLKLTSQVDIRPVIYHKPASIETEIIPAPKPDVQSVEKKTARIKNDTLHSSGAKNNPPPSPFGKKNQKVTAQPHPNV